MEKKDGRITEAIGSSLSETIKSRLIEQFQPRGDRPTLRLSQMGPRCPRALWYSIHRPELAQPVPPWTNIKFSYGHILEALVIALAKAAGHRVEGEQDEVTVDGVLGHRDCVIDGCLCDIKSCSSLMFKKLKSKTLATDDPFGYLCQLDAYVVGSAEDPIVITKDRGYIVGIDKTLGKVVLYEHIIRQSDIRSRISAARSIVNLPEPPGCNCGTRPHYGGNIKLDTRASYSAQKYCCFPGIRTFLYAEGPVDLVKVVRKPDVPEIDRYGQFIY